MAVHGIVKCELGHDAEPRRGWRLAWYEPRRRVGVYLPAPLHLVARAWRELKYRCGVALHAPTRERQDFFDLQRDQRERHRLASEFTRGYLEGWQECIEAWREVMDIVEKRGWSN